MNLLLDSWQVLSQDRGAVFAALACIIWGSIITLASLRVLARLDLSVTEHLSLALAGWVIPLFLASVLVFAAGVVFEARPNNPFALTTLGVSAAFAIWADRRTGTVIPPGRPLSWLLMLGIFLLSSFLHLAFIARTSLPLYIDSAEHYQIIQILIQDFHQADGLRHFVWPVPIYYHLGFHLVTAMVTAISQEPLAVMILILGPFILGGISIPLFAFIRQETGSDAAGLAAVGIGSFGWYMPAYAVNWGKYPALLSLPAIQFCLGLLYLYSRRRQGSRSPGLLAIILLTLVVAFVIHTRSIILIGISIAAWILAGQWNRQGFLRRILLFAILAAALITETVLTGRNPVLSPLLDPYLGSTAWATLITGGLSVFALKKYPRFALACLVAIFFLILGLFIPIPHSTDLTLLDRPLVEMIVFLPLSLLCGLGVAALGEWIPARTRSWATVGLILLLGVVISHALMSYSFYPSDCCILVGRDDVVALDWLDQHLPGAARIAISSTQIRVIGESLHPQSAGADAGVWITPLTDRATLLLPYTTDFTRPDTLQTVCGQGITDIYVAGLAQSFNRSALEAEPDWYRPILFLPGAQIYQVKGCH